ncbi:hypothetical protein AB0I54_21215 [Streptomyces sp. NPDC050625]|uniref:hypothetical protein n=1 Tax=Streptomyces sp. NPDC050625 TaxID=3154629 RepID=UPI0034310BE4
MAASRVHSRLAAQDVVLARSPDADRAAVLGAPAVVDLDALAATSTADRGITLEPGGIGGGKSFKLRNFRLDFAALVKVGAASVASVQAALVTPYPLVIAAGLLTIAQSLVDTTTVQIGEDEASLFWAFVQTAADRDDKTVTEDELRAASAQHRREFDLEPFTPAQFSKSLRRIEALSSIRPQGESRWRLTEKYRVS